MVKQHNRRRIEQALLTGDKSTGQLAAELHMGNTTAWRWLQAMVADGQAHVCAMVNPETGGPQIAVYRRGAAPEGFKVLVQPIKTQVQLTNKYRKKLRETGDWDDVLVKQRAYYWRTKPPSRDRMTAALFGRAA